MFTALSLTQDRETIIDMIDKDSFTRKLAKRIKQVREEKGVSQEELAHRAGLYRTYVGHLENARYSPSCYVLFKIAHSLKVKLSELLNF